jgi:hypothetical protein
MVTGMVAAKLDGVTFSLNVTSTFTTFVGPQKLLAQPVLLKAMLLMVGAEVSTKTPVVVGGVKVRVASLLALSRRVPPFNCTGEVTAMPSVSLSPLWVI